MAFPTFQSNQSISASNSDVLLVSCPTVCDFAGGQSLSTTYGHTVDRFVNAVAHFSQNLEIDRGVPTHDSLNIFLLLLQRFLRHKFEKIEGK